MDSTYVTEQLFLVDQMNYLRWKTFHDVIRHLKQSEPVSFKQVDFVRFKKKLHFWGEFCQFLQNLTEWK